MIRPININLNAAHPELPLVEATTFTGAPSSVFIRGVPKAVGNWSITAVSVAVTYPDNTTTARAAVESAEGVWVATIPGTATSGRTAAGFKIMADSIDENGAAVTGYVLGFADFSVLSFTPVPAPGGTFYLLRYFDAVPTTPKKGDVAIVGGILKYYNGAAWLPFTDLSNYYTAEQTDEAIDKLRDKLDLNVYGYGNASVTFADGFSVSYNSGGGSSDIRYTAPSGGETITFIGPVPSSNPNVPNHKFYYPSSLGNLDSFDPNGYSVWCLVCDNGGTIPSYMMYMTGPYYNIGLFDSETPTLTLAMGEATGDAPTMARPIGATGDTLAKVSQLADKANRAPNPTAGNLAALDAQGNPTDAGYRFEVRNGIPYIIETTND